MKNLVLDHGRRWWWVYALSGVYGVILGWSLATPEFADAYWQGKHSFLEQFFKIQSSMLLMQSSCAAIFTGAMLLLFDLQRGLARVCASLPLTSRQLGRSWWVATAGAPAAWQIAWVTFGAGLFYGLHPGTALPVARLLLADLLLGLWFGTAFVIFFVNYAMQGRPWGKFWNFITGVALIWMEFGFVLSLNAQKSPVKWAAFLTLGVLMTAFGWWQAGRYTPGQIKPTVRARRGGQSLSLSQSNSSPRPSTPLAIEERVAAGLERRLPGVPGLHGRSIQGALTPLAIDYLAGMQTGPKGTGDISPLIKVTFYRAILFCLSVAVWMPLALAWQGRINSWPSVIELVASLVAAYWALSFFAFAPVLRQLRSLRTLPLSGGCLALILIGLALLPVLAMGALTLGVAWLTTNPAVTWQVVHNFLFVLAPASLCLGMAVWRGTGIQTYVVLLLALIGFQVVCYRSLPLSAVGGIAAGCILLGFLAVRAALNRSSHAYRSSPTPFGHSPWLGSK